MVARFFEDQDEIEFAIPESSDFGFNVYSTRYHMTHGDQFRGGTGIQGVTLPVLLGEHRKTKRELAIGTPFDILVLGHFHQYKDLGTVIMNGSLKGYDEYAYDKNFPFEDPKQAF